MSGVSSSGFVMKTLTQIIADVQNGYRTVYGASVNIASRSRVGQRIALFAGSLAEVWEAVQDVYDAQNPDTATGASLDNVAKLNGLSRKPATFSTVTLTLTGTAGTVVASGKRAAVPATGVKFGVQAATIASVSSWAGTHAYSVGDRVKSGSNGVYQALNAGTSGSVTPSGTSTFNDNGIVWQWLGLGTGAVDTLAQATVTGALQGFAGTVNTIDTPVSGWQGVTNLLDASVGSDNETDPDFRARRSLSFSALASTPLDSVREAVLAVTGVSTCVIFENYTDVVDASGLPGKSFECLVEGGVDADILAAIYSKRPGGIQPYGTTSGTVNDSLGGPHTIAFSRPTAVDVWVLVTVNFDARSYPSNGDLQIQESIEIKGDARSVGRNVVASEIGAGVFSSGVPGVLDVPTVLIGLSNPPTLSAPLVMTNRQKANFDTSRIGVISFATDF